MVIVTYGGYGRLHHSLAQCALYAYSQLDTLLLLYYYILLVSHSTIFPTLKKKGQIDVVSSTYSSATTGVNSTMYLATLGPADLLLLFTDQFIRMFINGPSSGLVPKPQ